jgi:hypothetical protein
VKSPNGCVVSRRRLQELLGLPAPKSVSAPLRINAIVDRCPAPIYIKIAAGRVSRSIILCGQAVALVKTAADLWRVTSLSMTDATSSTCLTHGISKRRLVPHVRRLSMFNVRLAQDLAGKTAMAWPLMPVTTRFVSAASRGVL